jgi:hypothetical protein
MINKIFYILIFLLWLFVFVYIVKSYYQERISNVSNIVENKYNIPKSNAKKA